MNLVLRRIVALLVALAYLGATAQHVGGLHAATLHNHEAGHHAVMEHPAHAHHGVATHSPGDEAGSQAGDPKHGMTMVGCGLVCAGAFSIGEPASARVAHAARYAASGRHGLALPPRGVEPPPPRT